METRQKVSRVI